MPHGVRLELRQFRAPVEITGREHAAALRSPGVDLSRPQVSGIRVQRQ